MIDAHDGEVAAPHHLLDDGQPVETCEVAVIGCGNLLRGDDAVGPLLVRQLADRGVPSGVRLVDGGTAGMDVAFAMRGARRVVLVDAAATGSPPGTVFRVPAEELIDLPPLSGLHTHNFRWDHALSFAAWLLGPERPTDVRVYLVEGESNAPGAPLTGPVRAGMQRVLAELSTELAGLTAVPIELSADGYLHLDADTAERWFPGGVLVATATDAELLLVPLASPAHGGLVLNRRNRAGDRSVVIHEVLGFRSVAGRFVGTWDQVRGAVAVDLGSPLAEEVAGDARGGTRGGGRARPVDGLPAGADRRGGRAAPVGVVPDRVVGPHLGGDPGPDRLPAPPIAGGRR